MNRTALIVGLLISLPLLVFLGLGFRSDPHTIESPLVGRPAPGFELLDLTGRTVSLAALRGKPVVLNFWATWCQPCIAEHPVLIRAAERWAGRAHFLGVIYHDEESAIERFLERRGAWGPTLVDPDSRVAIRYGVYGAPETFIIDVEGIVREKVAGAMSPSQLERLLSDASRGAAS
ncbi:MAG: redoxin domain-containing protein [Acidobacteriota bacterium]|nr:redoxin domain-containing protein [Acidobacteriota bacterium]MDH3522964.1 redoxin domain-containing protein [Acidobacteriota bacterium]